MNMKRTMILLSADTHKRLKHLAIEQETSLGQVIREAVDALIVEDREDIARGESLLKSFRPGTGTRYEAYRFRRLRKGRNGA
jgi:predicted DNA-binding protein